MRRWILSLSILFSLLMPISNGAGACQQGRSCEFCYMQAVSYGAVAQEACLQQGGGDSFCDALFHAEACLWIYNHCPQCSDEAEQLCTHH